MTDKRIVGSHGTADDTSGTWSRVSRLSQEKFKEKKYSKGRKQSRSPCLNTSFSCRRDFETPKRRSRNCFNGCSTGDSPSEAEALQDIIWDPASPPPMWNGKGGGGVEISDLVKRIAPNDEKPVDRDLVLQWIGDSAVPCTPEIQMPRVRRVSARRQSNNVEDLMKLAKQFDINMTRQDKERQLDNEGRNAGLNKLDKSTAHQPVLKCIEPSARAQVSVAVKSEGLSHEEELHALFDGPTQHVSGRLSPPSVSGSQESRSEPKGLSPKRSDSAQVPKPDFDDDWENDDLLNDSFVLEMTQNPELLSSAPKKSADQRGSVTSKKSQPTSVASSSDSGSRAGCPPHLQSGNISHYTRISSNPGTYRPRPNAPVSTEIVQQLPKTSPDPVKSEQSENNHPQAQISRWNRQQVVKKKEIKDSGGVGVKDSDSSVSASRKDLKTLDSVWGDGDDDDLLYQACDDVERISASQEQQALTSDSPTSSLPKGPSSVNAASNVTANNKTVQEGQAREHKQPVRIFGRSHSIPGTSATFGNKQNLHETSQLSHNPERNGRYRFTQLKNASGAVLKPQWTTSPAQEVSMHGPSKESSSISHQPTFKRHQSDPLALGNKVFVTAQPTVKCTAAEIERKKQEAIARRRSRQRVTQNPGAPT